jgi:hypothetical protein
MGSIVSQVGQKCYRECEKSSRGVRVHGILTFPEPFGLPGFGYDTARPAPTRVARSELNSTEEGQSFAHEDSSGIRHCVRDAA